MAQVLDTGLNKIGRPFILNNNLTLYYSEPEIFCSDSVFHVSWRALNQSGLNQLFSNRWKVAGHCGTYGSAIFDAGSDNVKYSRIKWTESPAAGKGILFRVRSAPLLSQIYSAEWLGPENSEDYYTGESGIINRKFHDSHRYIQYKAYFLPGAGGETAKLHSVEIEYDPEGYPTSFDLRQNYPNPFNPETTIEYSIPTATKPDVKTPYMASLRTMIKIYDVLGREVATIVNENKSPGNYEIKFDASDLPSGVYIVVP